MNCLKWFLDAWKRRHPAAFLLVWGAVEVLLLLPGLFVDIAKRWWISGLFWGTLVFFLWLVSDKGTEKEKSVAHTCEVGSIGIKEKVILVVLVLVTILSCILPMGISPTWNGEDPEYRNQYEYMTEALMDGRLWMDYYVDPKLDEINPYDDAQRKAVGAAYRWDHAYYNGRYYMYFGVVPIFLTFMPYRIITGTDLTTYKSTQVFTAGIIIGIFWLFYLLSKRFFKKISFAVYATVSTAVCMMSVWYAVGRPAMYCTAITSAICMEVWSLCFFVKAVWDTKDVNKQLVWAFFGAGFGALAFGCRPSVALANILVLPMLWEFLQQHKINWKLVGKMALAASPYVVVAALLMKYNYSRFDNPFEFGQTYQLTLADQSQYTDLWTFENLRRVINGLVNNFFGRYELSEEFPYIPFSGAYINFPLLLTAFAVVFAPIREKIREHRLGGLVIALFVVPMIITAADTVWTPFLLERYRMDIYYVMGMLSFLVIGIWYMILPEERQKRRFAGRISQLAVLMVFVTVLLRIVPQDDNPTAYYPEFLQFIKEVMLFGA